MARMPGVIWDPLPENKTQPLLNPTQVVLHSIAGGVKSALGQFRERSNLESHFLVDFDGTITQIIDTGRTADAQRHGNVRAISIETASRIDAKDPWTPLQLEAIKRIILWAHRTHKVMLRRIPEWTASGVGYHVMWGSPSVWTPIAKSCPGPARIKQFDQVIVPWLRTAGVVVKETAREEEHPMAGLDAQDQAYIAAGVRDGIAWAGDYVQQYGTRHPIQAFTVAGDKAIEIARDIKQTNQLLRELIELIKGTG